MNTVPTITPGSITGMTGLEKRPVFFLKLNNSAIPNLVVKGEVAGDSTYSTNDEKSVSVKWGSKLMKNVNNPLVNVKIMTPAEITVFMQTAARIFSPTSIQFKKATAGAHFKWVKMPYVAGLSDADPYNDKESKAFPPQIKKVIEKFSDEQVWFDLGRIVAVDIFNGNNDRFNIVDGDWVNQGNVMFLDAGVTKVIGLDTFDPSTDRSNLARGGSFDALHNMSAPARIRAFAEACARSVGKELHRLMSVALMGSFTISTPSNVPGQPARIRKVNIDELPNLFLPYAETFGAGIVAGASDLRTYLQDKVRQYRDAGGVAPPPLGAAAAAAALPPPPALPGALPPPPVLPNRPIIGQRPPAINLPPPPPPPRDPRIPVIGQGRIANAGLPAYPPPPAPPVLRKTIPQGVLDRMAFLGWAV